MGIRLLIVYLGTTSRIYLEKKLTQGKMKKKNKKLLHDKDSKSVVLFSENNTTLFNTGVKTLFNTIRH